jgi:AAA15 family ATPase/GTPase
MQTNLLESFTQAAINAHNWTSFSPEKRGEQLIKDYNEQLSEDMAELSAAGIDSEVIESYKARYINLFNSWLSAKSRTFSSMITGGSNFPVRRHEKANRSEENHYKLWQEWRARAKKAITRKAQPEKTFLSEIDRYKQELEACKINHAKMKEGNKRIAAAIKSKEDITTYLTEVFNIKPHMIDWTMKFGFGLSNNSANMRRLQDRIALMEKKETLSNSVGQKEFPFTGGVVIYNFEADRIQIKHDSKPEPQVLYTLKSNGFRWSPTFGVWQRQMNSNGVWAAERVLNIKLR